MMSALSLKMMDGTEQQCKSSYIPHTTKFRDPQTPSILVQHFIHFPKISASKWPKIKKCLPWISDNPIILGI